jgi:hypothetical protein
VLRGPAARWAAVLVAVASVAAVAAVPRSAIRRLVGGLHVQGHRDVAAAPAASPPAAARPDQNLATLPAPRGVTIMPRGHAILAFQLPQVEGSIHVTTSTTPDPHGPRVSVLATGDGATYTVSQDTIAINNRDAPLLDYDVVLPPPSQLPAVSIRVANRVVFSRNGDTVRTAGMAQSHGAYTIPFLSPVRAVR